MNNVLLDELPTYYVSESGEEYEINTWFQIGIQIMQLREDKSMSDDEKTLHTVELLFLRGKKLMEYPQGKELEDCIQWFLNGWYHDKHVRSDEKRKLIDYDVDQWRIFSDFWQIYHINLNEMDMHWWQFCGMLWNMPNRISSFLQVISIRQKKIESKMGSEEKKAIKEAQQVYGLGEKEIEKAYSDDEKSKIDDYDRMIEEARKKKATEIEIVKAFER